MTDQAKFEIRVHDRIAAIGQPAWDACAGPTGDPFVAYDFLHACEASGSAVPREGWGSRHLSLHDPDGAVIGVMPLYLKGHSQGDGLLVVEQQWRELGAGVQAVAAVRPFEREDAVPQLP